VTAASRRPQNEHRRCTLHRPNSGGPTPLMIAIVPLPRPRMPTVPVTAGKRDQGRDRAFTVPCWAPPSSRRLVAPAGTEAPRVLGQPSIPSPGDQIADSARCRVLRRGRSCLRELLHLYRHFLDGSGMTVREWSGGAAFSSWEAGVRPEMAGAPSLWLGPTLTVGRVRFR
jgi:hypothetical protein